MDIYAENILEHYKNPQHRKIIPDADFVQTGANPLCGDHFVLYLKIKNKVIEDASFEGQGCAISQASADILIEELIGMSIEDAKKVSKDDLLEMLGVEIGPARMKCALLVFSALKEALK